jgi:hypothetical protein
MTANPKWPLAYHYPTDSNLTIDEVIEMRKGNDPRAGDLHCHKGCYPHSGTKILSRDCSASNRVSHFAGWPGEPQHATTCAYYSVATSRREHINYAQYLHDLRAYFEELKGSEKDPFMIESLEFPTGLMDPCISIKHRETANLGWNVTNFIIVHSNHGRAPRNAQNGIFRHGDGFDIVIRITEFTEEQLGDFQRTGIERLNLSWEKLLEHAAQEAEREAEARRVAEELQHMEQIRGAIWDNEIKFNTKLDLEPSQFTRKEDVDAYFNQVFKDQIEAEKAEEEQRRIEQEAMQAEIQNQISELSNELGVPVDRNFATMEDFDFRIRLHEPYITDIHLQ